MYTTSHLQIKPNFYSSKEECLKDEKNIINTNLRYNNFNQTHFTAGDTQQFQEYRKYTNGKQKDISLQENIYKHKDLTVDYPLYKMTPFSVDNTFNYIFHKFKKGLYVKILDNRMEVFLPFSNKNFINEWSKNIHIDPKYNSLLDFLKHVQLFSGYSYSEKNINKFIDSWYANNCLIRYEYPIHEGDTGISVIADFLETLCKERKVPDCEFFINRRDFPILKLNKTEAYDHIFGKDVPLLSHNYDNHTPIFSMSGCSGFADIPMPTIDDWSRVEQRNSKYFSHFADRNFERVKLKKWSERKNTAVFRGSSTGVGVDIETNPRLKLAYLSYITPPENNIPLLDAGITDWNFRPRKIINEKYLKVIDPSKFPFKLVEKLTPQEQSEYKYIIDVEGHSVAFRLSLELETGWCVLLVESEYKLWYSSYLIPYVHYVPVKHDLSDLIEKIKWCRENDEKCKQIAKKSKEFAEKYLSRNGILDFFQKLLVDTYKSQNYNYIKNCIDIQFEYEKKELNDTKKINIPHTNFNFELDNDTRTNDTRTNDTRTFSFFCGIKPIVMNTFSVPNYKITTKNIFNSKNSEISVVEIKGINNTFSFCKKDTKNMKTGIHEIFVGTKATNHMLKLIPNFCFIYGGEIDEKNNICTVYSEYINGPTLSQYIKGNSFCFVDYLCILTQIGLSLELTQKMYGFIHYDLTPWNIILKIYDKPITISYPIDKNVYHIKTKIVPIIIDLGMSHAVIENKHYGQINMFSFNSSQDIFTLLSTSIYEICGRKQTRVNPHLLIQLSNFLSGTSFRKYPFVFFGKDGLAKLRRFFFQTKKFCNRLTITEQNKTPFDLVSYILGMCNLDFYITDKYEIYNKHDSKQIFDFIFSQTTEEKKKSYDDVFKRLKTKKISKYTNLKSVYDSAIVFDSYFKKYEKVVSEYDYNIDIQYVKCENTFNENIFYYPEKIKEILEKEKNNENENADIFTLKDYLQNVF